MSFMKRGVKDFKDFQSIIVVRSLYKLLTKVLANGLESVTGKVISTPQNTFVEGRPILDPSFIAVEPRYSTRRFAFRRTWKHDCHLEGLQPCKLEVSIDSASYDGLWREVKNMGGFVHLNCKLFNNG